MGITGKTSTKGLNGAYASGNLAKKISVICIFEFDWALAVFITNHFNKILKIHNKIFDWALALLKVLFIKWIPKFF